jgi:hypothetical protein
MHRMNRPMPKIAEKNLRHRTKIELCNDIAFVLNSNLHYGSKYAILSDATWVWTEFEGKYVGCEYWSEAAWNIRSRLKERPNPLVHEHVIPKGIVIKRLLELPDKTADSVNELMAKYCIGAVVTKAEDDRLNSRGLRSKMPDGWNEDDVWARYKEAEILLRAHQALGN